MRVVAISVVIRNHKKKGIQVHTQTRRVIDPDYDSLYDGTEETCGETLKAGEDIINTAIRGCKEELGSCRSFIKKIIGGDRKIFSTRPGRDKILAIEPYFFVQQILGPQPWIGPCFVVVVQDDFEPILDKEGEVSAHQWWKAEELLQALKEKPEKFMGLHYPVLLKICEDIITGKLTI